MIEKILMTAAQSRSRISRWEVLAFLCGITLISLLYWLPLPPETIGPLELLKQSFSEPEKIIFISLITCFSFCFAPIILFVFVGMPLSRFSFLKFFVFQYTQTDTEKYSIYRASLARKAIRIMIYYHAGIALTSRWTGWEILCVAAIHILLFSELHCSLLWFTRRNNIPMEENPPYSGKLPTFLWIFTESQFEKQLAEEEEEHPYWMAGVEEEEP